MKRIALIVGHNEKSKGAFCPHAQACEFDYWKDIASEIQLITGVDVFTRRPHKSYSTEMKEVIEQVHCSGEYDLVIELHFNAVSDPEVHGAEILIYKNSKCLELAKTLLNSICQEFKVKNRGLKRIKSVAERGGFGIIRCKYPYMLVEPFFASNENDSEKFANKDKVVKFFVDFIQNL